MASYIDVRVLYLEYFLKALDKYYFGKNHIHAGSRAKDLKYGRYRATAEV